MPYPNVGQYNPGFNPNGGYQPRMNNFGMYQPQPQYPGRPMYGGDPMMYAQAQNQMVQPQQTNAPTQQTPIQPQQQSTIFSNPPAGNTNWQWVIGPEGAKAYQMYPGTSLMLLDSENDKFYIKTADLNGKRTIETYTYQRENENGTPVQPTNGPTLDQIPAITKDDIRELEDRLMAKFDGIQAGYDDIIAAVNSFSTKNTRSNNSDKQNKIENKEKDRDKDKK